MITEEMMLVECCLHQGLEKLISDKFNGATFKAGINNCTLSVSIDKTKTTFFAFRDFIKAKAPTKHVTKAIVVEEDRGPFYHMVASHSHPDESKANTHFYFVIQTV